MKYDKILHMGAQAAAGPVKRVRKLLRLAKSPNEHEAARAREQARALMAKHGLTERDVAEDVLDVVDINLDDRREWMAVIAARLHRVAVVVSEKRGIAFKGNAEMVARARSVYGQMIYATQDLVMVPVAPWLQEPAREVWGTCWWEYFSRTLRERFPESAASADMRENQEEKKDDGGEKPRVINNPFQQTFDRFQECLRKLAPYVNIDWFRREACDAGKRAAEAITLPTDDGAVRADRSLGPSH